MIRITTEPTTEPVTLEDAKSYLGITGTTHDTRITAAIKAARKKVEQLCGRSLAAKAYTLVLHDYDDLYINLPYPVVSAITTVKSTDSQGTVTTHTAAEYDLIHSRLYFVGSTQAVEVVYTTAANAEEFYKTAIKKQLAYDYRNEYNENGFDQEVVNMLKTDFVNPW